MAERIYQLSCTKGKAYTFVISMVNDAFLNIDLGKFEVSMEVRMTRATTSRLIATFNESNARLKVDRTARTLTVSLTSAYTLTLPESKNYYAIKLAEIYDLHTGATKEAFRVIEGRFDILPQVVA